MMMKDLEFNSGPGSQQSKILPEFYSQYPLTRLYRCIHTLPPYT
jgi:hypothetical protein